MAEQRLDDQLEHTYSSSELIRDVALWICQKQWTIGSGGKRGSGLSVLIARHDDEKWTGLWLKFVTFRMGEYVYRFWKIYVYKLKIFILLAMFSSIFLDIDFFFFLYCMVSFVYSRISNSDQWLICCLDLKRGQIANRSWHQKTFPTNGMISKLEAKNAISSH